MSCPDHGRWAGALRYGWNSRSVKRLIALLGEGRDEQACWEWPGRRDRDGYGIAGTTEDRRAHRSAWRIAKGEIPEGLLVLHRCDNPPCVNPSHLFLGTHQINQRDKWAKGRAVLNTTNRPRGDEHYARRHPERTLFVRANPAKTHPEKFRGANHWSKRFPDRRPQVGEKNTRARLTDSDVIDIRTLRAFGARPRHLAEAFGITRGMVTRIVARGAWRHLP